MEVQGGNLNRETVKRDRDKFFGPALCHISSRVMEVIDVSSATIRVTERDDAEIEQIPSFGFRKSKSGCLVLQVRQL
jgi:hypothetical protein